MCVCVCVCCVVPRCVLWHRLVNEQNCDLLIDKLSVDNITFDKMMRCQIFLKNAVEMQKTEIMQPGIKLDSKSAQLQTPGANRLKLLWPYLRISIISQSVCPWQAIQA